MNTTNRILLSTLAGLSLLSAVLFFFSGKERSDVDKELFRVPDTSQIDHAVLSSPKGNIDLTFSNGRWQVNQQYEADAQMIKVFFAMMRQVEPRRPVSASRRDSVRQWLEKGTRIQLFSEGIPLLEFYAGGNGADTWFVKEGDTQPYLMTIPGYRVYVGGVLELDEGGWRNKRVFDFNWRNFRSLRAIYTHDDAQGFEVVRSEGAFEIKGMATDTTKLNNYLDAVSLLFATRFVPAGKVTDSLRQVEPGARIEIMDVGKRVYALDLFPPSPSAKEILGRNGAGEVLAFDKKSLSDILRRRSWFRP